MIQQKVAVLLCADHRMTEGATSCPCKATPPIPKASSCFPISLAGCLPIPSIFATQAWWDMGSRACMRRGSFFSILCPKSVDICIHAEIFPSPGVQAQKTRFPVVYSWLYHSFIVWPKSYILPSCIHTWENIQHHSCLQCFVSLGQSFL